VGLCFVVGLGTTTVGSFDADGRTPLEEFRTGTSPFQTDTGQDEPGEGAEPACGIILSGQTADTDENGVSDGVETPDSDGDGLPDRRERELGTNASERDSDGDRLLDGWEVAGETPDGVPLPSADPTQMDLYVELSYAAGVEPYSDSFLDTVERDWEQMPVEAVNGTTGIDLHITQGERLDTRPSFDGSNYESIRTRALSRANRTSFANTVFVTEFSASTDADGRADVPGRFALLEAGTPSVVMRGVFTHELLHNVMGELDAAGRCANDSAHYCAGGWLEPRVLFFDYYLPTPLAQELEDNGFETELPELNETE